MKNNIKTSLQYHYYSLCYHYNENEWSNGWDEHVIETFYASSAEDAVKQYLENWNNVSCYKEFWKGVTQAGWEVDYLFYGKSVKAYIRVFKGDSPVNIRKFIRFNGLETRYLENHKDFDYKAYEEKYKN